MYQIHYRWKLYRWISKGTANTSRSNSKGEEKREERREKREERRKKVVRMEYGWKEFRLEGRRIKDYLSTVLNPYLGGKRKLCYILESISIEIALTRGNPSSVILNIRIEGSINTSTNKWRYRADEEEDDDDENENEEGRLLTLATLLPLNMENTGVALFNPIDLPRKI